MVTTFLLPDGTAWRFSSEVITDESGARYTQVVASEVSDLIKAQGAGGEHSKTQRVSGVYP